MSGYLDKSRKKSQLGVPAYRRRRESMKAMSRGEGFPRVKSALGGEVHSSEGGGKEKREEREVGVTA